ncbi:hypothetical protein H8N01_01445, partial [Streptomyces sp. AC536]
RPTDRGDRPKYNVEKVNIGLPNLGDLLPNLSFNYTRVVHDGASRGSASQGFPGADFLSNEDIRSFCEYGRKDARRRATERAMDFDHLEARLASIPDTAGQLGGARARARRVVKHGRRIAQAEKLIARWYATLYGAFEREYEAELVRIGRGRQQQPRKPRAGFAWR